MLKKLLLLIILGGTTWFFISQSGTSIHETPPGSDHEKLLAFAFASQQSDLQVQGSGKIVKILPDDNQGSRHQRMIIELDSKQTLLIAHNIDLAPRVPNPKNGSEIEFFGEYEWNAKGGVIHWTHKDPKNQHIAGWLKYQGKLYQ